MLALSVFLYGWLSGVVVLMLFVLYGVETVTVLMRHLCCVMEYVPFLADLAYGAQHASATLHVRTAAQPLRDIKEHVLAAQGLEGVDGSRRGSKATPLRLSAPCVLTWLENDAVGTAMDCRLALCNDEIIVYERLPMQGGGDTRTAAEHVMGVIDVRHTIVEERRVTSSRERRGGVGAVAAAHVSTVFAGRVLVLRARHGHSLFVGHDDEAVLTSSPLPSAGTAVHADADHVHPADTIATMSHVNATTHAYLTGYRSHSNGDYVVAAGGNLAHASLRRPLVSTSVPSTHTCVRSAPMSASSRDASSADAVDLARTSSSAFTLPRPTSVPATTPHAASRHAAHDNQYTMHRPRGCIRSSSSSSSSSISSRSSVTSASEALHDGPLYYNSHNTDSMLGVESARSLGTMPCPLSAQRVQALEADVHLWRSVVIKFATPRETEQWRCVLLDSEEVNDWRAFVRGMANTETANLFISRFLFQNMRGKGLQEAIRSAIRKKLQKLSVQKFPRMLGGQLLLDDFVIGKSIPWLSGVSEPAVSANGEMGFDFNLHYHGEDDGFSLYFRLALTFFGVRIPHIVLVLKLLELEATLHVSISPPPAKKFWLSGHKPPLLRVKVAQAAASGKGVLHRILTALPDLSDMGTNLLKLYCLDEMVLPFMDDFPLPNINTSPPHTPVEKVKTFDWHRAALMSGAPVAPQVRQRVVPAPATAATVSTSSLSQTITTTARRHADHNASATTTVDGDDGNKDSAAATRHTQPQHSSSGATNTATATTTTPACAASDRRTHAHTVVSATRVVVETATTPPPASTARTRLLHATVPADAVRSHIAEHHALATRNTMAAATATTNTVVDGTGEQAIAVATTTTPTLPPTTATTMGVLTCEGSASVPMQRGSVASLRATHQPHSRITAAPSHWLDEDLLAPGSGADAAAATNTAAVASAARRVGTTMAVVGGGSAAVLGHTREADPTAMTRPILLQDTDDAAVTSGTYTNAALRRKRSERDVRRALRVKAAHMNTLPYTRALPGGPL